MFKVIFFLKLIIENRPYDDIYHIIIHFNIKMFNNIC